MGTFNVHDADLVPLSDGYLDPESGHCVYWACYGNPTGTAALLIHGGPGTGTTDNLIRLFELGHFFVVVCDQRGSGRSLPLGRLEANNPDALVNDLERLRCLLKLERWMVVGGSWGSTMALHYAEKHPARVTRMVLWGVWLFRPEDINWHIYGARPFLPEAWDLFAAAASWREGEDLLDNYAAKIFDPDPKICEPAAAAWKNFERQRRSPENWRTTECLPMSRETTNMSRIMVHYFKEYGRTGYLDILGNADRLRSKEGVIVHGRTDLITPFKGARELAQCWPSATLVECDAGHNVDNEDIREAVRRHIAE